MARVQLTTTLAHLDQVVTSMRKHGVLQWTDSPIGTITLGPDPIKIAKLKKKSEDPLEQRRDYYNEILGYTPSDDVLKALP